LACLRHRQRSYHYGRPQHDSERGLHIYSGHTEPKTLASAAWRGGRPPAVSAPDGCGMILIEGRVDPKRTRHIVLCG
jgi:hypothetical protein